MKEEVNNWKLRRRNFINKQSAFVRITHTTISEGLNFYKYI